MPALLPPPTIGRCSVSSRSFLLGPDGPAGAPPGQALRSGALIGLRENREHKQDPYYGVSTVRGEPRSAVLAAFTWPEGAGSRTASAKQSLSLVAKDL